MNRKKLSIGVLTVALLLGFTGFFAANSLDFMAKAGAKAGLGSVKQDNAAADEIKSVATSPVRVVPQPSVIRLTGTLAADERSEVAANTSGIVQEVLVERGSIVEKGDVVVKIDPTDAKNMLVEGQAAADELKAALGWDDESKPFEINEQPGVKTAKAALDLAQSNFNRYKGLFDQKAISKAAYDQAYTEYESARQRQQLAVNQARQLYQSFKRAQARIATLEKALKDTQITAPFSGLVAERYVNIGERVSSGPGSGAKVVSIVKIDPLRLLLTIPQQSAGSIKTGQTVNFQVDTFPGKTFSGTVKYIGPNVENISRSLVVEALVPNSDRMLRPGFFATAELATAARQDRLLVPREAVVRAGDTAHVFVVRGGIARQNLVVLGAAEGNAVEVVKGLAPDDVVVTDAGRVRDGDKVS